MSASHIANIEKKINEAENIINDLLYYSRIKMPKYEKVAIYDLLSECIDFAEKKFYKQNIIVAKKLKSIRKTLVEVDPLQFTEIFNNILNNAFQAILNKNGKISINASIECKKFIIIDFKDNGIGIDKEDLDKIFEPFFTKKAKGTGLGLTICNELINLHGGIIDIKSKKGKGTTVTLKFPIKRKTEESQVIS